MQETFTIRISDKSGNVLRTYQTTTQTSYAKNKEIAKQLDITKRKHELTDKDISFEVETNKVK